MRTALSACLEIDGDLLLGAVSLARRKDKPIFRIDEQGRLDRLGLDQIMRLVSEKFQLRHQQLANSIAELFDFGKLATTTEIAQRVVDLIGGVFEWEYVAIFRKSRGRARCLRSSHSVTRPGVS